MNLAVTSINSEGETRTLESGGTDAGPSRRIPSRPVRTLSFRP